MKYNLKRCGTKRFAARLPLWMLWFGVWAVALANTGCDGSAVAPQALGNIGTICLDQSDCPENLQCIDIPSSTDPVCTVSCAFGAACPTGTVCVQSLDGSYCAPEDMLQEPQPLPQEPVANPVAEPDSTEEPSQGPEPAQEPEPTEEPDAAGEPEPVAEPEPAAEPEPETESCIDAFEPNDELATATPIESGLFDNLAICPGDVDLWSFEAGGGAPLDILVTFLHDNGDLNAELLNPDGETILRSSSTTDDETLSRTAGRPGTYYIRIEGSGPPIENTYAFSLSVDGQGDVCNPDNREPNDSAAQATSINPGTMNLTACAGDDDWFRFSAQSGDVIELRTAFSHPAGDLTLSLYESDGTTRIDSSQTNNNEESISWTATSAGEYLARIETDNQEGGSSYTFSLSIGDGNNPPIPQTDCNDRFENNDLVSQAAPIEPGVHNNLTLCDFLTDSEDFYAIELLPRQTISARIDFNGFVSDLDFTLYDQDGFRRLDRSAEFFSSSEAVVYEVPTGGTYYLGVNVASLFPLGTNNYTLTVNVQGGVQEPTCSDDSYEPNNLPDEATPLDAPIVGAVSCPEENDFYLVEVTEPDTWILAEATFDTFFGDVDLAIVDENGDMVLVAAETRGETESIEYLVEEPGEYLVRATLATGTAATYDLTVTTFTGTLPCRDHLEPNNTRASASTITHGIVEDVDLCAGEDTEDWYALELAANQIVTLDLTFTHADADLDLSLYAPGATAPTVIAESQNNNERNNYTTTVPGIYYVRAFLFGNDGQANYTLQTTVEIDTTCMDALESNNTRQTASLVGAGTVENLGLCGGSDTDDWDTFEVVMGQGVTIDTSFVHTDGDLDMEVFEPGETIALNDSAGSRDTEQITFTARQTGVYVLHTYLFRGMGRTNYTLAITVADPPPCQDRFESNNSTFDAPLLTPGTYENLDLCSNTDEADLYRVVLEANQRITATLTFEHADGNLDIGLFEPITNPAVSVSRSSTDNEEFTYITRRAGDHFIQILVADNAPQVDYTLTFTVEDEAVDPCVDLFEPNNSSSAALPIEPLIQYALSVCNTDEHDWYALEVEAGETIDLTLLFPIDSGLTLKLFHPNGTRLEQNTGASEASIVHEATETGRYLIDVHNIESTNTFYNMEVDLR